MMPTLMPRRSCREISKTCNAQLTDASSAESALLREREELHALAKEEQALIALLGGADAIRGMRAEFAALPLAHWEASTNAGRRGDSWAGLSAVSIASHSRTSVLDEVARLSCLGQQQSDSTGTA